MSGALGGSSGPAGERERMLVSLQRWPAAAQPPPQPAPPGGAQAAEAFKPRFLRRLEERLDAAQPEDAGAELSPLAMEVYQHTFERLIEEFRTYGPLLSRIKAAYDRRLQQHVDKIAELEPAVQQLGRQDSEQQRAVARATRGRDERIRELERQLHDLREEVTAAARLRKAHNQLKAAHAKATKELDDTRMEMGAQHEISQSLVKTIQRQEEIARARDEIENGTLNSQFTVEQRLIKLTKEHQDLLERYDKTQTQLDQRSGQLAQARELHAQMQTKFDRCERERTQVLADYQKNRTQYRAVRKRMREGTVNGGDGRRMDPDTGRPLTARPEWADVQRALPQMPFDTTVLVTAGTSVATDMIAEWLTKLANDLKEAEAALPWKTANEEIMEEMQRQRSAIAAGDAGFTGKWFVCQGTGPNVPKFLRFNGKVRNRMMAKRDAEVFIKEFWEHKIKADTRPRAKRQSVADHMHNFMKARFGVQATIAEFAYNFCDALQRYQSDADCEIFHKILFGELCEDCYHAQMQLIEDLMDACERKDKPEHGGKVLGVLAREQFNAVLNQFLPTKSANDMQVLKQALSYDQPLADIGYRKLFEENRDGDQGKFAEALRDQHLYDTLQTYRLIESQIRIAALVAAGEDEQLATMKIASNDFGDEVTVADEEDEDNEEDEEDGASQQVTLLVVKQALRKHDPGMTDGEIDRIITAGVTGRADPRTEEEGPELFSDYRQVQISDFVFNMRCIYIGRYSRIAAAEAEAAAVPPRTLGSEEQQALRAAFDEVDITQSGRLPTSLVGRVLGLAYTISPSDAYMQKFAESAGATADEDGEPLLTFNKCVLGVVKAEALDEVFEWRKVFLRFDSDSSGTIDADVRTPSPAHLHAHLAREGLLWREVMLLRAGAGGDGRLPAGRQCAK